MIKRILLWFISIYFKQATTEIKTPEVETMSDVSVGDSQPADARIIGTDGTYNHSINITGSLNPAPDSVQQAAAPRVGVADFEKALSFVESGVVQLGEAAKDELKELAKKYL